jgi:PKHD-type hydroxylase
MIYKGSEYWRWDKEISHEICQKLINLGKGKWKPGQTLGPKGPKKNTDNIRKSDVVWIEKQWVFDLIWPYMLSANEAAGWKYEITAAESCQITRYTKDGFYTWHKDGLGSHNEVWNKPGNKFLHGNVRKLSLIIALNSNFEDGNFEMGIGDWGTEALRLEEGSMIIFPSFQDHRVTPITKGIRYSLVIWFLGPPFV